MVIEFDAAPLTRRPQRLDARLLAAHLATLSQTGALSIAYTLVFAVLRWLTLPTNKGMDDVLWTHAYFGRGETTCAGRWRELTFTCRRIALPSWDS